VVALTKDGAAVFARVARRADARMEALHEPSEPQAGDWAARSAMDTIRQFITTKETA
jgi:hypothetical protein